MDAATTTIETRPSEPLWAEVLRVWKSVPDKVVFGVLLAAWVLLFYYFGCTSAIVGRTASLYDWMYDKWNDPANDAEHGKLIPFAVVALLWVRRKQLADSLGCAWWPGLAGLAVALGLHVVGFLVQQPRISMVALFSGMWVLVGLVWGWRTLKVSFFPFFVFAFCVPVGGTFAQGLTLPLRMGAASATYFTAHTVMGVPLERAGTKLINPKESHGLAVHTWEDDALNPNGSALDPGSSWDPVDVAAECSGIRSFIALLAITTIFSVLTMQKIWKRAVLIALTIPLSVIFNVLRLTTIILVGTAYHTNTAVKLGDKWFGFVTYALGIGCVLLVAHWLRERPAKPPAVSP